MQFTNTVEAVIFYVASVSLIVLIVIGLIPGKGGDKRGYTRFTFGLEVEEECLLENMCTVCQ